MLPAAQDDKRREDLEGGKKFWIMQNLRMVADLGGMVKAGKAREIEGGFTQREVCIALEIKKTLDLRMNMVCFKKKRVFNKLFEKVCENYTALVFYYPTSSCEYCCSNILSMSRKNI